MKKISKTGKSLTRGLALCSFLIAWGQLVNCFAVEGEAAAIPEVPDGPLINPVPNFSKWVISITYPQESRQPSNANPVPPPAPDQPRTITTTKTGDIIHEVMTSVGGDRLDKWQVGQLCYIKLPGDSYWGEYDRRDVQDNATTDPSRLPVPDSGFRNVDWIESETFSGTIEDAGTSYLLFLPKPVLGETDADISSLQASSTFALINAETRHPYYIKDNGLISTYSFEAPPNDMQELPGDLLNEIREGKERRAKVLGLPTQKY